MKMATLAGMSAEDIMTITRGAEICVDPSREVANGTIKANVRKATNDSVRETLITTARAMKTTTRSNIQPTQCQKPPGAKLIRGEKLDHPDASELAPLVIRNGVAVDAPGYMVAWLIPDQFPAP